MALLSCTLKMAVIVILFIKMGAPERVCFFFKF